MIQLFPRNIAPIIVLLPLALVLAFLIPLTVMAEPGTPSCPDARLQIEDTQNILRPLKQHQQQLQQHVRVIYQKLFACQTRTELSLAQQKQCTQLQEEGLKQFQAMVEAITLSHQTSRQLAHQTRQAQLTCPASVEDTLPQIIRRVRS